MEPKRNNMMYWVGGLIAIILAAVLGLYVMSLQNEEKPQPTTQATNSAELADQNESKNPAAAETAPEAPINGSLTIAFSDNGFDKSSYTVKKGQVVTVKNTSSNTLQFSSDNHPTHLLQPELNTQPVAAGASTTFTPTKVGTWGFHDHLKSQFTGTLVVTE